MQLNQFNSLSHIDTVTLPGNILITLLFGENRVSFKSFVLKNNENCQHYYINFLLNYYESFAKQDNNYHLEFQLCYFELQPLFSNHEQKGYKLKNLKENFIVKQTYDQIIAVTTYKEMYFLYVIMLSRRRCFILDPQLKPQSRFSDHERVAKTLLEYFQQPTKELQCYLLKEVKQDTTPLMRGALILDFLYKYIDPSNLVEKIENIKIRSSSAKQTLDRINWFVYRCYKDNVYITNEPRPQPKLLDKMLSYDEWKASIAQNSFEQQNKLKNDLKMSHLSQFNSGPKPQFNKSESSFSILSLMGQNQISDVSKSAIEMNAQSFIQQRIYDDVPKIKPQIEQTTPVDAITKQEFEMLLRDAKQQIRNEVLQELHLEQEERMKLYEKKIQNQYNPLDEQIAQEYLTQVKFQRYKEYLDYLMEYYYNNDRQEYQNLINQYNQRLKDAALNGMVEVQKQEMIKLQSITKRKLVEQNQQLELALYNQKKELQHLMPAKQKFLEQKKQEQPVVIPQGIKGEYKFVFGNVNLTIDPFEFKTEQQVEQIRKQQTALDELDLSNSQIQEMENAWKFDDKSSKHSVYNYEEELERLKQIYENKNKPTLSQPIQSNRQSNQIPMDEDSLSIFKSSNQIGTQKQITQLGSQRQSNKQFSKQDLESPKKYFDGVSDHGADVSQAHRSQYKSLDLQAEKSQHPSQDRQQAEQSQQQVFSQADRSYRNSETQRRFMEKTNPQVSSQVSKFNSQKQLSEIDKKEAQKI